MTREELEKRVHEFALQIYKEGYEEGLEDAWECARKIILSCGEGGYDAGTIEDIFGMSYHDVLKECKPNKAIELIKEYEERKKQDERKVDCEVTACYNCVNHNYCYYEYAPHCIYSDKEVAESFLEDVSAVEEQQKQNEKIDISGKEDAKTCGTCKHVMRISCGAYPCNECPKDTLPKWEPNQTDATDINDGSIKVGDEIRNGGVVGVVTQVRDIECGMKAFTLIDETGKTWGFNDLVTKKTGRYFPQIAEVLEQLRGEE